MFGRVKCVFGYHLWAKNKYQFQVLTDCETATSYTCHRCGKRIKVYDTVDVLTKENDDEK